MSELLVFISSIMDKAREDLYAERDAVKAAIESIGLTRSWRFEDSPASSLRVDYSYLNRIAESDIFLLILGRELTNPVRMEYNAAVDGAKPLLVFIKNGDRSAEAKDFIKTIGVKWKSFDKPDALGKEVRAALAQELIDAHRQKRIELPADDVTKLSGLVPAAAVAGGSGIAVGQQSGGANVGAGARVGGHVAGGNIQVNETRSAGRDYYEARDQATINVQAGVGSGELSEILTGMMAALKELQLSPYDEKRVKHALDGAQIEAEAPAPDKNAVAARLKDAAEIVNSASGVAVAATKFGKLLKQGLTWAGVAISALT